MDLSSAACPWIGFASEIRPNDSLASAAVHLLHLTLFGLSRERCEYGQYVHWVL